MSQTGKMLQYINYRMRVTVTDGRQIVGRFMAFDKHLNVVLGDAEEFRQLPPKKGVPDVDREVRRALGLIILRGDEVVGMVVEGPPPKDEARMVKAAGLVPGPGVGRAAAGPACDARREAAARGRATTTSMAQAAAMFCPLFCAL